MSLKVVMVDVDDEIDHISICEVLSPTNDCRLSGADALSGEVIWNSAHSKWKDAIDKTSFKYLNLLSRCKPESSKVFKL